MESMIWGVQINDWKEVVNKLIPDHIDKGIEKACLPIYPLPDVFIRKLKILKQPQFEFGKIVELHGDSRSSRKATGG